MPRVLPQTARCLGPQDVLQVEDAKLQSFYTACYLLKNFRPFVDFPAFAAKVDQDLTNFVGIVLQS